MNKTGDSCDVTEVKGWMDRVGGRAFEKVVLHFDASRWG